MPIAAQKIQSRNRIAATLRWSARIFAVVALLFALNVDVPSLFEAGAQGASVRGQGTPQFLPKWVVETFDYSLTNSGNISVPRGSAGVNTITRTIVSGTASPVTLSASGLPAGAGASFTANPCSPICSSTLTISTLASTPTGTFPITVTGAPLGRTTAFNLIVTISTQCSDAIDNDGDGINNFPADPGCSNSSDDDERNACTDGLDNDGDDTVDFASSPFRGSSTADPGCSSLQDNSEANPPKFCEVNPDDPNAVCQ